jgi:hypothetical protein
VASYHLLQTIRAKIQGAFSCVIENHPRSVSGATGFGRIASADYSA